MVEDSDKWLGRLETILQQNLHVEARQTARAKYSPDLTYGRHFAPPGPTARSAAVMILLERPTSNSPWYECTIPLTVRPTSMSDHPGQISLPGGRLERGESFEHAAIREFSEELGIANFPGRVLGSLLPMWVYISDFRLIPFVAVHVGDIAYQTRSSEVERVIRLPITELVGHSQPKTSIYSRGSVRWNAGVFDYQQDLIWGATAVVLAELAEVLRQLQN